MQRNSESIEKLIMAALEEDVAKGDVTSQALIPEGKSARFVFVPREEIVMCGGGIIPRVFHALDADAKVTVHAKEGTPVQEKTPMITVEGNARALLAAERTALNILQRLCGVATLTRKYVEAVKGTKAVISSPRSNGMST